MELTKLTATELRGYDKPRMNEVEKEIRGEMAKSRITNVINRQSSGATKRNLRRSLARLLTVKRETAKF